MSKIGQRLSKLEAVSRPDRDGPEWWAVQKWLGHRLTAEQDAAVAAYDAARPRGDALDLSGCSRELREWLEQPAYGGR